MTKFTARLTRDELKRSWFIPLRLSVFLLLFGALVLSDKTSTVPFKPFLIYSLATLLFLYLVEIRHKKLRPSVLSVAILVQFALEVVVEGTLIHSSNQLTSQYSVLFLLTIVSASLVYRLAGTLLVATLAAVSFTVFASLYHLIEGGLAVDFLHLSELYSGNDDLFYAVFLHVCTFYLVAFISGFLAQKLRVKEGELDQASERLREVQLDTDTVLRNLHSGLISIDNMGEIIFFNYAAGNILGLKERDVRGKTVMEVFGRRMPELAEKLTNVLRLSKPSVRSDLEIVTAEGRTVPIGLTTSVLADERTGVRGVIAIFQDLTTAKQMEQALIKADRLAVVGELAAGIAHEIRNPLASISGSVEVLKGELEVSGDNVRLMELIVQESERLSRILTDFLTYARTRPAPPEKVELVSLVGDTIELLKNDMTLPKSVLIDFKSSGTTTYVVASEDQLKQILINLITNAAQAVDKREGRITVVIDDAAAVPDETSTAWICLKVSDNGSGLNAEDKKRVFEPFYSRKSGGTGLGLAVVKRCVDNIDARIEIESQPHQGTTFSVLLQPYSAAAETSRREDVSSPPLENQVT